MNERIINFIRTNADIFCCPSCRSQLHLKNGAPACQHCGFSSSPSREIPRLFCPDNLQSKGKDTTGIVKDFYEETPFPDYDDFDDLRSLVEKTRKGLFVSLLDRAIPREARILECGCGTGQLSNFLSLKNRTVIGTDISLNSLKHGNAFREKNNLENAFFIQMNLLKPCFKPQTFDIVIANGVLHHTANPFLAFETISDLLRPGGMILIGLYHRYGRLLTSFRRLIYKISSNRLQFLDPRLRDPILSASRKTAWFMDQYRNPRETRHTLREILRWLKKTRMEFIRCLPGPPFTKELSDTEKLFEKEKLPHSSLLLFSEPLMAFTANREGGFFLVIAKKI